MVNYKYSSGVTEKVLNRYVVVTEDGCRMSYSE